MPVNLQSRRVDELLSQLRQLTGRGATELMREALEHELQRQRQLQRLRRLGEDLPKPQQQAVEQCRPFALEQLYDDQGLPA